MKSMFFAAVIAVSAMAFSSCSSRESQPREVRIDQEFADMYMKESGGVTGADGTISILLDDGSSLFMTGDCFAGTVEDGKISYDTPMLRNSLIHISKDGKNLGSIFGGTPENPETLCIPAEADTSRFVYWYWPGHGFQLGNTLFLYMTKFYQAEDGQWGFRFDGELDRDIMRVGLPASLEMILISISTLFMNLIIESVDPVNGVAIYTTGWRILDLLMVFAVSFGSALVPISAAAYGQRSYERIRAVYVYALKYGVTLMVSIAVVAMLAAPLLVHMFTYTGSTTALSEEMTRFVRIGCVFLPFCMVGILTSSLFQSVGKGMWSMGATVLRNFLRIPLCYALAPMMSLTMVWWGVTAGEIVGTTVVAVSGVFALRYIRRNLEMMGRGPSDDGHEPPAE